MPERLPLMLLPGHMCDARLFGPQLAVFDDRPLSVGVLTQDPTIKRNGAACLVLGAASLRATPTPFPTLRNAVRSASI